MWGCGELASLTDQSPDCVTGKEFVIPGSSLDLANEINSLGETFQRRDHIRRPDLFPKHSILLICFNSVLTSF